MSSTATETENVAQGFLSQKIAILIRISRLENMEGKTDEALSKRCYRREAIRRGEDPDWAKKKDDTAAVKDE